MTNEENSEMDDPKGEPNAESGASDERANATSASADELEMRRDQDRRVIIFASVFLVLLAAPVFLPVEGERSFWRLTRHDDTARAILALIFGWPVCLGVIGFVRGLQRKAPGKVLIGVGTVLTSLQALGGAALVLMILASGYRDARSPLVWMGGVVSALAIGVTLRSFFRRDWQRFQHIMAAIAFLGIMIVLAFAGSEPRAFQRVELGGWFFLFATAALVPFVLVTLTSRRT